MDFRRSHVEEQPARCTCSVRSTLGSDEIRLLEVSPAANRADRIKCTLRTVLLAEAPDYEAVSYVWGNQTLVEVVRVDSVEERITGNLHDLLINLRYQERVRTIWVDALCINQKDGHERSEQVKLMGRIYQQAARVVAFLGQEWDGVDIACEYLELAARRADVHLDPSMDPHLKASPPLIFISQYLLKRRTDPTRSVAKTSHRPVCATISPDSSPRNGSFASGPSKNLFLPKTPASSTGLLLSVARICRRPS